MLSGNCYLPEPVYIVGDFNYNEIKWNAKTLYRNNQCSLNLLENHKSDRGEQLITFHMDLLPVMITNLYLALTNNLNWDVVIVIKLNLCTKLSTFSFVDKTTNSTITSN